MAPSLQEPLLGPDEISSAQENGQIHTENGNSFYPQMSKTECLGGFETTDRGSGLQSDLQTVVNTMNLYVGVGVLSLGYAVKLGGWISLGLLAALALILCHSAKLICKSFDRVPPALVPSYPNLGRTVFGSAGQWAVMLIGGSEFFGALCLCLIVIWQSITMLLPSSPVCIGPLCLLPSEAAIVGSTLFMVPAVLIRTFSRLTSISVSGVLSSLLLTSVVVVAYAVDPQRKDIIDPASSAHKIIDWAQLPMGAGIMIVSLSGHAGVPSLRRSMKNPHHSNRCINLAFLGIFLIYATMGGFAYLYFGEATQVLITGNLNDSSSVTGFILFKIGRFSLSINQAVIVLVAMSAFTTSPALVYVISELLGDLIRGDSSPHIPGPGDLVTRTIVLGAGYIVAITAYNVLGTVESIVGGVCSVTISLLLPCLFYFKLYEKELSLGKKCLVLSLCAFSAVCVVAIGSINGWLLVKDS